MFFSCDGCVLSDRGLCVELITLPGESSRMWCPISVIAKPCKGRPGLGIGSKRHKKKKVKICYIFVTCSMHGKVAKGCRISVGKA